MDLDAFKNMLATANISFEAERGIYANGWIGVTFKCEAGIGGSREGLVTAVFNPEGKLDNFMFCD